MKKGVCLRPHNKSENFNTVSLSTEFTRTRDAGSTRNVTRDCQFNPLLTKKAHVKKFSL